MVSYRFTVPAGFTGRELWLQFNGINYYAEVWLNGQYLGHITGAFIRGEFDVTRLAKPGAVNVLAVMVAPPPDPGIPSEQSVKGGPGDNGGTLCLDGPTFVCSEGWDWIPAIARPLHRPVAGRCPARDRSGHHGRPAGHHHDCRCRTPRAT